MQVTRKKQANWLLVCGSGRNVGKSTFVEILLQQLSRDYDIVAVKISPHKHHPGPEIKLLESHNNIRIYEELRPSEYDSGRFLEAGACRSFYLEANDAELARALDLLSNYLNPELPVICESGKAGSLIEAGLMIFIGDQPDESQVGKWRNYRLSDIRIGTGEWEKIVPEIGIEDSQWHMK